MVASHSRLRDHREWGAHLMAVRRPLKLCWHVYARMLIVSPPSPPLGADTTQNVLQDGLKGSSGRERVICGRIGLRFWRKRPVLLARRSCPQLANSMEGEAKKWIFDMAPSAPGPDATKAPVELEGLSSLPSTTLEAALFISSVTWLPMTVKDALDALQSQDASAVNTKANLIVVRFALALHNISLATGAADSPKLAQEATLAASYISSHVKLSTEAPLNTLSGPSSLELLDAFLAAAFSARNSISDLDSLEIIQATSRLYLEAVKPHPSVFEAWYNRLLDSKLRLHLFRHKSAQVSALQLQLELKLFLSRYDTLPIPVEAAKIFCNVLALRISTVDEIPTFMPVISLLSESSQPHYMSGSLALLILESEALNPEQKSTMLHEAMSENAVLSDISSLLMTAKGTEDDRPLKLLSLYMEEDPSYAKVAAVLDNISYQVTTIEMDISKSTVITSAVSSALNKLTISERFQYLLNWLLGFESLSSLDRALTQTETLEDTKDIVKPLENFMRLIPMLTPPSAPLKENTAPTPSSGRKVLIEEIDESVSISVPVYHDLMSLIIMRLDIPDYFFCLSDTKLYDSEKFVHDNFRVEVFHRLVNHFWTVMDSLISYMPPMELITADNPLLLLPEGVKPPIQVPPWFDSMLVIFAIYGMRSDFSTKTSTKEVEKCVKTLVDCDSVRELGKNPFALRLRQTIALVKAKEERIVDEATKFSIIMWLCYHVPLAEMKPSKDSLDEKIFEALVTTINETLTDHRPNIKILGLDLVLFITRMLQFSANQAAEASDKSESKTPLTSLPHLPQTIFDAIIRSFTFREMELVELALETTVSMLELRSKEEAILLDWTASLMKTIAYEIDYVQKQELLELYLRYLPKVMPLLGLNLLSFSHPLLVRLVSLLDLGSFRMTSVSLKCIEVLMAQTWPRIHVERELIFGALCTVWIDQVWVLPSELDSLTDTIKSNIETTKDGIYRCMRLLIAILPPSETKRMMGEVLDVPDLKDLHALLMPLYQARIAADEPKTA